jgi:hypothetical protein
MPNDIAISAISAGTAEREVVGPQQSTSVATPIPAASSPGSPSPTLHLDAALGLVVIEFLGKSGAVTSSIPTPQQLEAYRLGTAPVPGQHVQQASKLAPHDT